ncbi:right-handed parallel beta-helix repeat-containing protein [Verrucomicrobiaceae bacterium N1E253]|uniref:Right-handed parallel beta-helix repeat-containing protein n=1 Tax=Oceaniferula marina TaxID=2748318 RepID=A0A851G9B8_9BACT|nr:right-handed parallel beta-helix repeat-containing protein [Oceaniferula marina]NWK54308.1 right-handed parallel beta-helix repeat-containing protein [Oceaniferula marina]
MKPGDCCLIRKGRYTELLEIEQLHGTKQLPITFKAWPGETVILDGTRPLQLKWEKWKDGIYRAEASGPVKQLFQNGRYLMPARWPNADIYDESVFDLHGRWRKAAAESTFGVMIDATPKVGDQKRAPWMEGSYVSQNTQTLSDTGKDFTGAVAVMNIGSWLSWAQTVGQHDPGSQRFTYSLDFERSGRAMARAANHFPKKTEFWRKKIQKGGEGYYYLERSLECLDSPGEWFYNRSEGWLYLMPRDGEIKLRSRQIDCGLRVRQSSHLKFEGLRLFACYASFSDCLSMTLDACHFNFPSATALGAGDMRRPEVTHFAYSKKFLESMDQRGTDNRVYNCSFNYCNGPALSMSGINDVVENCQFYAIDWMCLGNGGEGALNFGNSRGMVFRRNTVDLTGNSEGVRVGSRSLVEYNHISRTGLLQHDGSAINVGVNNIEGSVLRRNWVRDTAKAALRFDSANMGSPDVRYGHRGAMIENVCWNTQQVKVKGDGHQIIGNTVLGSPRVDVGILDRLLAGGINTQTLTARNLAGSISGAFHKQGIPIPGKHQNNWTGDVGSQLTNVNNFDFRPRQDSEVHLAGRNAQPSCQIGAYSHDPAQYWIPGHLSEKASMPIPRSGSKHLDPNTVLMWRPSLKAKSYLVYWGEKPERLVRLQKTAQCYLILPKTTSQSRCY